MGLFFWGLCESDILSHSPKWSIERALGTEYGQVNSHGHVTWLHGSRISLKHGRLRENVGTTVKLHNNALSWQNVGLKSSFERACWMNRSKQVVTWLPKNLAYSWGLERAVPGRRSRCSSHSRLALKVASFYTLGRRRCQWCIALVCQFHWCCPLDKLHALLFSWCSTYYCNSHKFSSHKFSDALHVGPYASAPNPRVRMLKWWLQSGDAYGSCGCFLW